MFRTSDSVRGLGPNRGSDISPLTNIRSVWICSRIAQKIPGRSFVSVRQRHRDPPLYNMGVN